MTNKLSKSPDRLRFLDKTGKYATEGRLDRGKEHDEMWERIRRDNDSLEADPAWSIDNMEHDLRTADWILDKVRSDDIYAQNLYAAMCNNEFVKRDVYNVLTDKRWSCSWRHAGGIVADMRQEGDYIDWYCSGSSYNEDGDIGYSMQPEGHVTDQIRSDLHRLGWTVIDAD